MGKIEKEHKGVIVPVITPVTETYKIDTVSVASIMKTFTQHQVNAFMLGTTGESTSVSDIEKRVLIKTAVETANGKIKVYAGVSSCCLEETIDTANEYAALGADAIVVHLPFYYPVDENNMVKYFTAIADNVKAPVILYNNPITVKQSMPVWVVEKLSYHKNIVGFKDSERGVERLDECIGLWKDRADFSFLLGWAAQSAYAVLKGCDGIVPSTGNLTPGIYKELYNAALAGDAAKANELQSKTDRIGEVYQKGKSIYESIPSLKVILSEYGICKPLAIPPMYAPEADEQASMRKNIREELGDYNPLK